MLILPLHHPLNRRTFPLATAALLLLNLFVFFAIQSGDHRAHDEAARFHAESGLGEIEAALYRQHLEGGGESDALEALDAVPPPYRQAWLSQSAQHDAAFRARLARGELFADDDAHAHWQALDERFRALLQRVVTLRFALDASAPDAKGLIGSMFLHGSLGHLLGNMLFLCALGLLVEGALGPWRFLALYLAAGVGAGLAWAGWQGGEPASLIGASGAIAGLMGALAVLWGLRRIRFFYWFFVVFDYVRAPALLLLPAWLGWELIQMFALPESRVAYSAHAGGIVSGALLAWGARGAGWVREDFMSDEDEAPGPDDRFAEAIAHLGQMRLAEAEALLEPLAAADPARLDVAIARYRAARYAQRGARGGLIERAEAVLEASASRADQVREQWGVLQDLGKADLTVSPVRRAGFAARLLALGEGAAALELLESVQETHLPALDLPQLWLRLGLALSERNERELAARALQGLTRRFPDSQQAGKAKFLLNEA
ncbi:MAG TPA: rhomboid family intramembrane serine protease [Xanthomonadaceae bacterium]|nr:rhomboid family intramembrane serine protease [Xanthomonadaceae bacterium]